MPGDPFGFDSPPDAPLRRAAYFAVRPLLSWALRLQTLSRLYRTLDRQTSKSFSARALEALDIDVQDAMTRTYVPTHGPVVIVANHPHGAVDGLALLGIMRRVRPDVRLLANHLLSRIPELLDSCFFVDPFGGLGAESRSAPALRSAREWLGQGGALIAFPSGEVAHRWHRNRLIDSPWRTTAVRLARAAGAQVVPVFIAGRNRRSFYLAGRVHPALRTCLLPRELLAMRGRPVTVRFGAPLDVSTLDGEAEVVTERIRSTVDAFGVVPALDTAEPPPDSVADDIARLPASARLLTDGVFDVYCAERRHLGAAMNEIGRLREMAYRAVGEGTGRERDLDPFDDHYLHLFTWNRERREIAGAYRLGRVDQILERQGVDGLYTRTLFRYDRSLLDRMAPALELGRSFVRIEYQRNHTALLLLWKGICRFVALNPQYQVLYGAVSISARYSDMSKQLLMRFLEQNHRDTDAAALVSAIHPPRRQGTPGDAEYVTSIERLDSLVSGTERDHKRIPVLLRQYLKLNARLLGFSVDPSFGDALDALMMVDLRLVDPAILRRYFGRDAATYLDSRVGAQSAPAA